MKFAKVFDVENDSQVLFWLTTNDQDQPEIQVITEINGTRCRLCFTFDHDNRDTALSLAQTNFYNIGQSDADEFYASIKALLESDNHSSMFDYPQTRW